MVKNNETKYNLLWSYLVLKVLNKLRMCFVELPEICACMVAVEAKADMSFWKTWELHCGLAEGMQPTFRSHELQ